MAKLSPKHHKALELFEEGTLSIREIAAATGFGNDVMYDLFEGNAQKLGDTAHLFKAELDKITQRSHEKTKTLVKDNKKLVQLKLNEFLKGAQKKKATPALVKQVVSVANTLNKATPNVEIGSFTYQYQKGMSQEELINEFTRLHAIARNALIGSGVPRIGRPGQNRLSGSAESGDSVPEE